jgi:ankyrin repeat protein
MSFFKRTQAELDEAFLKAAADYKVAKAKRLLKKGANVLAKDKDGNTALHKMARNNPDSGDCQRELFGANYRLADDFVCFLLGKSVDINAANKYGKTCLHYAAGNADDFDGRLISVLLNRGADANVSDLSGKAPLHYVVPDRSAARLIDNGARVGVQDNDGKTPLHVAAAKGDDSLIQLYLKADRSSLDIKDKDGKYPHDSAVSGPVGHFMLSRSLLGHLNAYREDMQRLQKKKDQEKLATGNDWVLLQPDQVAHVKLEKGIGYKLTEIFNFRARTYTVITQNLETKAEMTVVKGFDDFSDKTLLKDGYKALVRLGGKADENTIYRQILNKSPSKLPRPEANGPQ